MPQCPAGAAVLAEQTPAVLELRLLVMCLGEKGVEDVASTAHERPFLSKIAPAPRRQCEPTPPHVSSNGVEETDRCVGSGSADESHSSALAAGFLSLSFFFSFAAGFVASDDGAPRCRLCSRCLGSLEHDLLSLALEVVLRDSCDVD